jgi:hypothetical protein
MRPRCLAVLLCLITSTPAGPLWLFAARTHSLSLLLLLLLLTQIVLQALARGKLYAAILSGPASVPYHMHPSWPSMALKASTDSACAAAAAALSIHVAGFGPTYAATLSGPASVPNYVHRSWPSMAL